MSCAACRSARGYTTACPYCRAPGDMQPVPVAPPARPDHIGRARAALVVAVTHMIHGAGVAAGEALFTANHHLGAASLDGTPMADYADVAALVTQHQVEWRALMRLLTVPARGGA